MPYIKIVTSKMKQDSVFR